MRSVLRRADHRALLILSTYLIGLRLGSRSLGLLATLLMVTCPPFLLMDFVNMTDVPVAGALVFGCWCLLGTTLRSAAGAGVALAIAFLIRPNLVPLVPLFVLWLAWRIAGEREARARHFWRAVIVLGGIGAAVLATSVIYWLTYGTPFESGYGATASYFAWSHIGPNVRNYAQWFNESHTLFGFLGLVALALPVRLVWPDVSDRRAIVLFALITAMVIGEFLIYLVMDNSSYLRFFLGLLSVHHVRAGERGDGARACSS
jgi:4-amino-4-deoxy-L-arabinose transferase-like glycosyltransferase